MTIFESLENRCMMAIGDASVFDVDQFEQNIRNYFVDNSVGFAYAINQGGVAVRSGGWGDARKSADGYVEFTEDTQMTIASVAKTITATGTLKILQDTPGVGLDSLIEPYLPAAWVRGPGINTITFRELLTHESGIRRIDFDGNGSASLGEQTSYAGLQQLIALGINMANKGNHSLGIHNFRYENANFALQRVMTAYLLGNGAAADDDEDPAQFTADAYVEYVSTNVLAPMGIENADTARGEDDLVLNYPYPGNGAPTNYTDRTLLAGGEGWWLSADELAKFLHGVRTNDDVLSPATRELMRDDFLGWQSPDHSYNYASGMFGPELPYFVHGGSLTNLETCIFEFPNDVQVSLLINSVIGPNLPHTPANSTPSKHELLKRAYENAWPELSIVGTASPDKFEVRSNPQDSNSVDIFLNDKRVVTRWVETLDTLTFSGIGGDDTFVVGRLPDNIEVVLDGGLGTDTFTVINADLNVQGDVTIDGGEGLDSLLFSGIFVFDSATYTITDGTIAKSSRVGQIHYDLLEAVTVHGGNSADWIYVYATGNGASVRVFGNDGNDMIVGGPAADLLDGGDGNDTIRGGLGNDTIYGRNGNDFIGGGQGNDLILCGSGNDIASGDSHNDTVVGAAGDDLVAGGAGNDTVTGGSDDDILVGGVFSAGSSVVDEIGQDSLNGGDGRD
ncbi:MAG: serine hydrolase, partial [Pirellulaceae bacterium]